MIYSRSLFNKDRECFHLFSLHLIVIFINNYIRVDQAVDNRNGKVRQAVRQVGHRINIFLNYQI